MQQRAFLPWKREAGAFVIQVNVTLWKMPLVPRKRPVFLRTLHTHPSDLAYFVLLWPSPAACSSSIIRSALFSIHNPRPQSGVLVRPHFKNFHRVIMYMFWKGVEGVEKIIWGCLEDILEGLPDYVRRWIIQHLIQGCVRIR